MQYIFLIITLAVIAVWWDIQTPDTPTEQGTSTSSEQGTPVEQVSGQINNAIQDAKDVVEKISVPTPSKTLDLSGQGLTKVPEYVFGKTEIESLDLSENNLTGALQAEVRHLKNLKTLDLSHNAFTGVPAEVGQLSMLETLDLSYNNLTGLPYELGNLKNLKVLNLAGNAYSQDDLAIIKKGLPETVRIITE